MYTNILYTHTYTPYMCVYHNFVFDQTTDFVVVQIPSDVQMFGGFSVCVGERRKLVILDTRFTLTISFMYMTL